MALTCRYYENKYPEIDDVVMVNVRSIADMGAYVSLLEYDNIEGMILLSELSRRRIRSRSSPMLGAAAGREIQPAPRLAASARGQEPGGEPPQQVRPVRPPHRLQVQHPRGNL